MNKNQLFKKYSIDESHNVWDDSIDNWMSVELYRVMHDGKLPEGDNSVVWICEFLDKTKDGRFVSGLMTKRNDFGSLYLTAKRMIYSLSDDILNEINKL